MTMTLTGIYGLELLDSDETPVTSYDWGDFTKGEVKSMEDPFEGMYFYLNNTGNSLVQVWWNTSDTTVVGEYGNGLTPWELRIDDSIYGTWDMQLPLYLDAGEYLTLEIWLEEVSANGGTSYSFDLTFVAAEWES